MEQRSTNIPLSNGKNGLVLVSENQVSLLGMVTIVSVGVVK